MTDAGAGMVILATDGAVEVVPRGGRPRTLQEGELGIFPGSMGAGSYIVRIGVMDRNGANKTTYNVPVQIRVGKGGGSASPEAADGKSG